MVFDFDLLEYAAGESLPLVADSASASTAEVAVRAGLSGKLLCTLTMSLTAPVQALKAAIETAANIPEGEQRLLFGDRPLVDGGLLGSILAANTGGGEQPEIVSVEVTLVRVDPHRAQVLRGIQRGTLKFLDVEKELRQDLEVVLCAVKSDGAALRHVPQAMRVNHEVALAAVLSCPAALQYVPQELADDRDVVLAAVRQSGEALEFASKELRADLDVALAAVRQDGHALAHVAEQLRGDPRVVIEAVRCRGAALQHATEEARGNRELVRAAVKSTWGAAIEHATAELRADRELMLWALRLDGLALRHASADLRQDREVVLAAVAVNGLALAHAAPEMQRDRAVVMAALEQDGSAFQYASPKLRGEPEVVLAALRSCRDVLRFAAGPSLSSRRVLLAALAHDPDMLRYATPGLMADPSFREAAEAAGCFHDPAACGWLQVTPRDAHELDLNDSAVFFDVRGSTEFSSSRIPGALLLDVGRLGDRGWQEALAEGSAGKTLVVYSDNGLEYSRCVRGAEALRRVPRLQKHQVVRLLGGLNHWKELGLPVEGDLRTMLLGRPVSKEELDKSVGRPAWSQDLSAQDRVDAVLERARVRAWRKHEFLAQMAP